MSQNLCLSELKCTRCKEIKPREEFNKRSTVGTRGYRSHCKKCDADRKLIMRFGITLEEWDQLLKAQGNKCQICKRKPSKNKPRFHVDHNHKTGEVRGLLCNGCNTRLGWVEKHLESCLYCLILKVVKG